MKILRKKLRNRLLIRARNLAGKGYSVIPIRGDTSVAEPKKPAIKWRAYQRRVASRRELDSMFDGRAWALAVVCGQVSRLLVIDFDDHLRYQRFCRHMPQYADSYTVKTRRGYHVYFRTREKVPSHQFDGGDIKGERSYVVAPPSVIAGYEYKAVKRHETIELDDKGVQAILNYFHVRPAASGRGGLITQVAANADISAMYDRLYPVIGRNNALYRCACVGQREGLSGDEIEKALLRRHVVSQGWGKHKYESAADRFREGRQTIASALRRGHLVQEDGEGIPNSVRERLLQEQRSSVTARLLDIMVIAGWRAESYFCARDAVDVCKRFGLSRKSVLAALTGECSGFNGRHIISRRYVEYLDIGGPNAGKRGRPVQLLFQVPSVARLLDVLGVRWSPSDLLSRGDLASGAAYRRALHREYVKRQCPGLPMSVMARRLGLNARTLRRYNAQLGVHVCERVGRFRLSWDTLKCLPRRERDQVRNQTPGYWLALGENCRFPAWRHIGASLLRRGADAVELCVRRASVMSLGKPNARSVVYESLSPEAFLRLRGYRGESVERGSMLDRLRDLVRRAGASIARVGYEKLRLEYDTVAVHIAEDKVAETIRGYLYAGDGLGGEVRRPARRGVAYRMLKEYGEGNVYLALRDSYSEVVSTIARHACRVGEQEAGKDLLARSMV